MHEAHINCHVSEFEADTDSFDRPGHMITVGDGFVEGKGILENYEGHDMFIVSGSGSGTGISVTDGYGSGTMVNVGNGQGSGNNVVVGDGHVSGLDIAGDNGELSGSDLTAGHGEGSGSGAMTSSLEREFANLFACLCWRTLNLTSDDMCRRIGG